MNLTREENRVDRAASQLLEKEMVKPIASANEVLLESEGYFLMQTICGRASLNL